MIPFLESEMKYLAVGLPDEISFFKFMGDFVGECRAIDEYMTRDIPHAMRVRLELERVIARGMQGDYMMSEETLISRVRERYPSFSEKTLEALIEAGHADYIRKNGERYYQRAAVRNIFNSGERVIRKCEGMAPLPPSHNARRHACLETMKKNGGIAYRYRVRERIAPRAELSRPGKTVRVHLPYPALCPEQSEITLIESSHPVFISDKGQRTAFIEVEHRTGEEYFIEFSYLLREKYHCPTPEGVAPEQPDFFTGEQYPQIRFTPLVTELARELRGGETNPLILARRAYDYVTRHVGYSYMRDYLFIENIPEFAINNGRGDCGIMALTFITLCRAMGVPARWQSGSHIEPDFIGSHDWAMFYVAPYGWMPCDPSFGGGALRGGDTELWDHYFCNLDSLRLINCTEFQGELDPPRRYLRTDPYDNQSGEIEYSDEPLWFGEIDRERHVVSSEEVEYVEM